MDQLRLRDDLHRTFGIDRQALGRGAITGKDSSSVWDYLRLQRGSAAQNFTEFPHLTLGIHHEFLNTIVTVPNGIRNDFRKKLLGRGFEAFVDVFSEILNKFNDSLGTVAGAIPWIELVQRRYPSQRSEPFIDALIEFDLRTSFPTKNGTERSPKFQPQWLKALYDALNDRNANLQLAAGVRFPYKRCDATTTPQILDHIASAWMTCAPLVKTLLD